MDNRDMPATNQANDTLPLPGFDNAPPRIEGVVQKVVHANISRGFSILRIKTTDGVQTVAGRGDPVSIGDEVSADGRWEMHPQYGRQFKARYISAQLPQSAHGIARYLSGGAIKGVGPRTTDKLVAHFGEQLAAALESPTVLQGAGIPEAKAKAIVDHWMLRTRHTEIVSMLLSHGIGQAVAKKIVDHYGDDANRIVKTRPYKLADDVHGIGFKKADQIALSQSMPKDAPERIRAGLVYQIQALQREGHCASPRDVLRKETSKLLLVRDHQIDHEIDRLLEEGAFVEDLIGQRPVLYERRMREREVAVADMLTEHVAGDFDLTAGLDDLDGLIDSAASAVGITLHDNQRSAVRTALASGVAVITGGPGTGKTSTIRTFIAAYEQLMGDGAEVVLAAPTGRAAKRMTEATGRDARTLHRLLGWTGNKQSADASSRDANREIEATALVVDESSMKDLYLIHEVMKALKDGCRLILVGDADQLPSVGPGNVLADIVESGAIPVARLTQIFRQSDGSSIAAAARQINQGRVPNMTSPRHSSDMWRVATEDAEHAADKAIRLASEVLPELGWNPLSDIQVLTPGHAHESGTAELNRRLQATLNPPAGDKAEIEHQGRVFRAGDRVIQTANNYDLEVFNGDIGNVVGVQTSGEETLLIVDYDGQQAVYRRAHLDQLQLAYAITIHKAQGSEFPVVICVMTTQHYIMLRRNLLYTAVTRARTLCATVGQDQAVAIAVRRDGGRRITGLAQRLAGRRLTAAAMAQTTASPDPGTDQEMF